MIHKVGGLYDSWHTPLLHEYSKTVLFAKDDDLRPHVSFLSSSSLVGYVSSHGKRDIGIPRICDILC